MASSEQRDELWGSIDARLVALTYSAAAYSVSNSSPMTLMRQVPTHRDEDLCERAPCRAFRRRSIDMQEGCYLCSLITLITRG